MVKWGSPRPGNAMPRLGWVCLATFISSKNILRASHVSKDIEEESFSSPKTSHEE